MLLSVIDEHCAVALSRAQLMEVEQQVREHLAFLAEAGEALASSLDFGVSLEQLGRLVVPRLADWYAASLPEGELLYPYGLAHRDPAKVDLLRDYVHQTPVRVDSSSGAAEIYPTGHFMQMPHLDICEEHPFLESKAPHPGQQLAGKKRHQ
ncbi:hypothetical protein [Deinococcus aquatilis]|uniref:hypothetical protein n=1 Tax=Deinococcus aquatilis TaxID=519440 RepID=UPI0003A4C38C|nr:hypothetical protein [Deinococcus aquatilis]